MAVKNNNQWSKSMFYFLFSSLWKRKLIILFIIVLTSFAVVALQYNSVSRQKRGNSDVLSDIKYQSRLGQQTAESLLPFLKEKGENIPKYKQRMAANKESLPAPPINRPEDEIKSRKHDFDRDLHDDSSANLHLRESKVNVKQDSSDNNNYIPEFRYVHFDLKGAPPKMSYLKSLLPLLKSAGATGILIEYEDTFPFTGILASTVKKPYSREELESFLDEASNYELEVIPIIQTFGHLEFVLKLEKFRHLREVDIYPMAICPSKNESFTLIKEMIDQIMVIHRKTKWLHIGCDEVFHMGMCNDCYKKDRETIFLDHVVRIAKYVREKHNVIPIIWDDMLRNFNPERIRQSGLGRLVEPMVWVYVKDVYHFVSVPMFSMFAELFDNVWAASAFKGAYGETLIVPNAKSHLENNLGWLTVMAEQHDRFKSFRGIVVTGWQRYDHFATLCELLPSGIPSLVLDLIALKNGHFDSTKTLKEFDSTMKCKRNEYYASDYNTDLESDPFLYSRASHCSFPGVSVFRMTQQLSQAVKRVNEYLYDVTIHKAWLTEYNVRHNLSNHFRVEEGMRDFYEVNSELNSVFRAAATALKEVFDKETTYEWIEQNIYPYMLKMEKLEKDAKELEKGRSWPVRPIDLNKDLDRFGLNNLLK